MIHRRTNRRSVAAATMIWLASSACLSAFEGRSNLEEQALQAAVSRVAPAVARIETVGGLERVGQVLVGTGPTTGLVVSDDGYVISSAFNFVQKPDSILISLDDGNRYPARLVATDRSRMLVLLKISLPADKKLAVCQPVPESEMHVGQTALAVGRTLDPKHPNVSVGIVSAVGRIWGKAVQTDAKISPNNYGGPLVDIRGRVYGVLVPMSPDGNAEVAGVEWYDSGIGFAIPLETINRMLPRMVEGRDLYPGLLGISMTAGDIYALPAEIAVSRAKGPAYKAGLRAGDSIVELAGLPIMRQAQLKQVLGRMYAGEQVKLVARRGDERIERELTLAEEIEPYEYPFLGILPMRPVTEETANELVVRYVYPDSPAAAAGMKAGDRITALANAPVEVLEDALKIVQTLVPDESVPLVVQRGNESLTLTVKLGRLPTELPHELPASHGEPTAHEGPRTRSGVIALRLPEFPGEIPAYVPESYNPNVSYGVIVLLPDPGVRKSEEMLAQWKPLCDKYDFILMAPQASDPTKWQPVEVRKVRRALDGMMQNYAIDPTRITLYGQNAGGQFAYLTAFSNLDLIRAVAVSEAFLPRIVQPAETDPVRRLAIFSSYWPKGDTADAVESGQKKLADLKYPVTVKRVETPRQPTDEDLQQLVRWFDSLDRL